MDAGLAGAASAVERRQKGIGIANPLLPRADPAQGPGRRISEVRAGVGVGVKVGAGVKAGVKVGAAAPTTPLYAPATTAAAASSAPGPCGM